MDQNSDDGTPVMRPLFLDFESDSGAYADECQYEYLYGEDLLVAPVVVEGAEEREVYLPGPQSWVYLWDGAETVLRGPTTTTVEAPLGQTPVFYRLGSTWTDLFRQIYEQYNLEAQTTQGDDDDDDDGGAAEVSAAFVFVTALSCLGRMLS